jgi:hypothetical protein
MAALVRRTGSIEEIMRIRPRQHSSWLFPAMVVAAASVVAFGALGAAVVTGHLGVEPGDDALVTAEAGGPAKASTAGQSGAVGLPGTVGHN